MSGYVVHRPPWPEAMRQRLDAIAQALLQQISSEQFTPENAGPDVKVEGPSIQYEALSVFRPVWPVAEGGMRGQWFLVIDGEIKLQFNGI